MKGERTPGKLPHARRISGYDRYLIAARTVVGGRSTKLGIFRARSERNINIHHRKHTRFG